MALMCLEAAAGDPGDLEHSAASHDAIQAPVQAS